MSPSSSVQVMTDAVVAQYIHEISVRHRPRAVRAAERADGHARQRDQRERTIGSARRELTRLAGRVPRRPGHPALPSAG